MAPALGLRPQELEDDPEFRADFEAWLAAKLPLQDKTGASYLPQEKREAWPQPSDLDFEKFASAQVPMVSADPAPPPEPPFSGAPKPPPADPELADAQGLDSRMRALRALEQGALSFSGGITRTKPLEALTTVPNAEGSLRARRAQEAELSRRSMLDSMTAQDRLFDNALRMLEVGKKLDSTSGLQTLTPLQRAELAAETERIKAKAIVDAATRTAESRENVADIEASGKRDAAIAASHSGAEVRVAEENRKKTEAEAKLERERLAAAARPPAKGGAGKGKATGGSIAEQKVALQRERMARGLEELEVRDIDGNKHRFRTRQEAIKGRDIMAGAMTMLDLIKPIRENIKKFGSTNWPTDRKADIQSKLTNLILIAKGPELYQLGVVAGPDMTLLESATGNPSGLEAFISGGTQTLARLGNMEMTIRLKAKNYAKAQNGALAPETQKSGGADATVAKLEAWIAANPKHPRLGEAQAKLRGLRAKVGGK